jgi:hypothetical protein
MLVAVSGCSSVSLSTSWKDANRREKPYRNLLVVGLVEKVQLRQVFEEVFAEEIRKNGATGSVSYLFTGIDSLPSQAVLEEAVKRSGADGIITTRLVGTKQQRDVHTGFVMTGRGHTAAYGESISYATFVHMPVDVTSSQEAALEATLFDTVTGNMVWSATSTAINPEGIISVSKEVADIAIKELTKDGLL